MYLGYHRGLVHEHAFSSGMIPTPNASKAMRILPWKLTSTGRLAHITDFGLLWRQKLRVSASFMSSYSCDCSNGREAYTRALMAAGLQVDNYGRCLRNVNHEPWANRSRRNKTKFFGNKLGIISRYHFTLAFENSNCPYWITEKLFQPLAAGSVPVYMGTSAFREFVPNVTGVIFVEDYASPADLSQHLLQVSSNRTLYLQYHAWRAWPLSAGYLAMPVAPVATTACEVARRVVWTE